jgi:hypothetical protein
MAFGSVIRDMKELVANMGTEFSELKKMLDTIAASQKRIEATVAQLLVNKDKK